MKALKKLVRFFGIFIAFLWLIIVTVVNPFIIAPKIEQEIKKEIEKLPNNSNFNLRGIQLTLNNYQRGFFASELDITVAHASLIHPIKQKITIEHAFLSLGGFNLVAIQGENKELYPLQFFASANLIKQLNGKIILDNPEKDQLSWQSGFFSPEKGTLKSSGLHVRSQDKQITLSPWTGSAILPLHDNGELKIDALAVTLSTLGKGKQSQHFGGNDITLTLNQQRDLSLRAENVYNEVLGKKQYLQAVEIDTTLPLDYQKTFTLRATPQLSLPFIKTINGQLLSLVAENGKIKIDGQENKQTQWSLNGQFPNPPFGTGELIITADFMKKSHLQTILQYQLGQLQQNMDGNYILPLKITPEHLEINQKIISSF